jgi:hypothetical protein
VKCEIEIVHVKLYSGSTMILTTVQQQLNNNNKHLHFVKIMRCVI